MKEVVNRLRPGDRIKIDDCPVCTVVSLDKDRFGRNNVIKLRTTVGMFFLPEKKLIKIYKPRNTR